METGNWVAGELDAGSWEGGELERGELDASEFESSNRDRSELGEESRFHELADLITAYVEECVVELTSIAFGCLTRRALAGAPRIASAFAVGTLWYLLVVLPIASSQIRASSLAYNPTQSACGTRSMRNLQVQVLQSPEEVHS